MQCLPAHPFSSAYGVLLRVALVHMRRASHHPAGSTGAKLGRSAHMALCVVCSALYTHQHHTPPHPLIYYTLSQCLLRTPLIGPHALPSIQRLPGRQLHHHKPPSLVTVTVHACNPHCYALLAPTRQYRGYMNATQTGTRTLPSPQELQDKYLAMPGLNNATALVSNC